LSKKYDYATQVLFISMMLTDPELYTRCSNILLPSYFDKKLAPAVKFLMKFAEDHNGLPNKQIMNAQTNLEFEILDINDSHKEWFLDSIEDFCKSKAIEKAILSGAQMLEEGKYGDIEKLIKDAVLISLQRDLGTDYFADPKERLEKLKEMNGTVSTGWKSVDKIAYQIGFGELILFTAISGGGKSVAMQNATINFALQGFNVVYYTFELSEELTAKRLDAMCTGVSNINIFKDIDGVALKVKNISKNSGSIHIKYMPSGSTPNDIKAHLREFTIQKGYKPDVIIVDYLDLLHPNQARVDVGNFFVKDKLVAEALRSLASPKEFNLICVSASQVNRGGYTETIAGMENMAGGMSKAHTADLIMHIHNTPQLRERGELEFQFIKTRNSGGVGSTVTMSYDTETLRIVDMPASGSGNTISSSSSPSDEKNNVKNLLAKLQKNN
jgi:archaellum biogenesis ATPase FlaH